MPGSVPALELISLQTLPDHSRLSLYLLLTISTLWLTTPDSSRIVRSNTGGGAGKSLSQVRKAGRMGAPPLSEEGYPW